MKRALELFSGSGRISKRFEKGGWDTTPIDIKDGHDVLDFESSEHYDFVWASPPCQDYSGLRYDYPSIWKADRTLWLKALEIIQKVTPRFWIIENVKMAQWIWGKAPYHYGPFFLWGYYPPFQKTIPWTTGFKGTHLNRKANLRYNDTLTAEDRSKIPESLAELVFQTIEKGLS